MKILLSVFPKSSDTICQSDLIVVNVLLYFGASPSYSQTKYPTHKISVDEILQKQNVRQTSKTVTKNKRQKIRRQNIDGENIRQLNKTKYPQIKYFSTKYIFTNIEIH